MKGASQRVGAPVLAPFAALDQEPADVPSWPLHLAVWLKPDRPPGPPQWSGLAIERRYRIPAPGFLPADITPADRPAAPDFSSETRAPVNSPRIPGCDAVPLGWDARSLCAKEKEK